MSLLSQPTAPVTASAARQEQPPPPDHSANTTPLEQPPTATTGEAQGQLPSEAAAADSEHDANPGEASHFEESKELAGTRPTTADHPSTESPVVQPRPAIFEGAADSAVGAPSEKVPIDADKGLETTDEADDDSKYLSGPKLWILSFGLCMSIFVVALDNTIIATAIPKITTVFNSLNDVGWYGSSYLLTTTSLQPSFGKIYSHFSVKWTYLSALVIFEIGSIICAAAPNSTALIIGRAIAGAGAAALFSGGMTIVGFSVPLRQRPLYLAMLSSMFGISSVVGPILGGALTDRASWRWCFWINLPFGGVALLAVYFFFHPPPRKVTGMTVLERIREIDLAGAFFLIASITCLLLALQWGGTTYPWHSSRVWGCLLGFGLLVIIFIGLQIRRGDRATIPPRLLLKQRTVLGCFLLEIFLGMGVYTHIYYLPIYFQAVKGTTAEGSGIRCIAYLVSNTIASIISGGSITALGFYAPFAWAGTAIFTVGSGLLYTLTVSTDTAKWIGYQVLTGFGSGAAIQIPFIAVQVVLNEKDMPTGNAMAIFGNTLGGALSISVAQNIFSNKLTQSLPNYAPGVNASTIINAGATNLRKILKTDELPGVLESYTRGITNAFVLPVVVGGLAFLASLLFEWKSVKGKKLLAAGAG